MFFNLDSTVEEAGDDLRAAVTLQTTIQQDPLLSTAAQLTPTSTGELASYYRECGFMFEEGVGSVIALIAGACSHFYLLWHLL